MNFLGEEFDSEKCNQMCDNCREWYQSIKEIDHSNIGKTLLEVIS